MTKIKSFLVIIVICNILISACSAFNSTPTIDPQKELEKYTAYYKGMWHQCIVNVAFSPSQPSVERIIDICEEKLQGYLDGDWYVNGEKLSLPIPLNKDKFKSDLEYIYYSGVWEQCFAEVATIGDGILTEAEMLEFCKNNLNQGMKEDWYSESNDAFPKMPEIEIESLPIS